MKSTRETVEREAKAAGMSDEATRAVVGRIRETRSNVWQVTNHVLEIAAMLEELAGDIRRHVGEETFELYEDRGIEFSWVRVASRVQHEVLWKLANLGLDNLTTEAERADRSA